MTGYILLAIVAGTLGGIHVPINGALGVRIQSTLVATFAFYGVAFLIIAFAFACALLAERAAFTALLTVPRWYYFAGIISVVVVGSSTFLIPRLGAVNVFVIFFVAQFAVRMVLSHFGWLQLPVNPISWVKLAGGVMLFLGALLVVWNQLMAPRMESA